MSPRAQRLLQKPLSIDEALRDPLLLGAALGDTSSWAIWFAVHRAAFGLPLSADQAAAFDAVAGGRAPPSSRVSELWCVAGRRSGKSRMAAAAAVFAAALAPRPRLAPGEDGHVIVIAPTRQQAQLVFRYCLAFLQDSPLLRQRIREVRAEEIVLSGNIVIGVHSCGFRTIRGRTIIAAVFDETAFWQDESSARPDVEIYRAVLPALASSGGLLIAISSPYRRLGLVFQKHRDHFGQDSDVLVVQGGSQVFNPTLDPSIIAKARADDAASAMAEWDAAFRNDLSSLLDDAVIDAALDHSRPPELPPITGKYYSCFVDASAGRHDHFTCAVGHKDGDRIVIDALRGAAPPHDPSAVAAEYAALAKEYRCPEVVGDNFGGEWVAGAFTAAGTAYKRAELTRSELYLESLPQFNRHAISLPNHARLIRELRLLERRVHRSGKDSVDHGVGGSDDYANSVCGVIATLASKIPMHISREALELAKRPPRITRFDLPSPRASSRPLNRPDFEPFRGWHP